MIIDSFIRLICRINFFSKHVVFGHVESGQKLVDIIEDLPVDLKTNRPLKDVTIAHCGDCEITSSKSNHFSKTIHHSLVVLLLQKHINRKNVIYLLVMSVTTTKMKVVLLVIMMKRRKNPNIVKNRRRKKNIAERNKPTTMNRNRNQLLLLQSKKF